MKTKAITGIVVTLFLVSTLFTTIPVTAQLELVIGIIGPYGLPHWSPGMKEAAEMARDEINAAGTMLYVGDGYRIVLKFEDEHAYPTPSPTDAAAAMEKLITVDDCDYIIGGFRTECTEAMVEVAADYGVPFIINGASTTELISETVGVDYERYKYLFRINPVNSTELFRTIAGFVQYYLLPYKLLPLYGHNLWPEASNPQVRVGVITEDLEWTLVMHEYLTNPAIYPSVLGPYANVTYAGRIPDGTTDCSPWLQGVKNNDCRLLIHVFSGVTGVPFIQQWASMEVEAIPLGINVMGQLQTHWSSTGGTCKYESFLAFGGTRTPIIPGKTEVFWDDFYDLTGAWPLYTAWGAYDAIHGLAEAFHAVDSVDKDMWVAYNEAGRTRTGLNGVFKYTSLHDVFTNEPGPVWTQGYVRSFLSQWVTEPTQYVGQNVVSPVDQPFSRRFQLPEWMYPISSDLNFDGIVDITDATMLAGVFGSGPEADPPDMVKWLTSNGLESDVVVDGVIDIFDAIALAGEFGSEISLPMP
jgi:branched-chain amino acid transport system substrate-binding protein